MVKLRELCLNKWYLIYITCIFNCLVSLLARNVITHSLCVVVFGSCDDLELVSGRAENRWMTMKNLMLEDTGTQCSDRM